NFIKTKTYFKKKVKSYIIIVYRKIKNKLKRGVTMDKRVLDTLENLKKNGFKGEFFETRDEAIEKIISEILEDDSISIGGSMTILDLGLYEKLKEKGNEVYWHWKASAEEGKQVLKKAIET